MLILSIVSTVVTVIIIAWTLWNMHHLIRPIAKRADQVFEAVAVMVMTEAAKKMAIMIGDEIPYANADEKQLHLYYNQHLIDDSEYQSSVELFKADPHLAIELGFDPPQCQRCGGEILRPPPDWNGVTELVHHIPVACQWKVEKDQAIETGRLQHTCRWSRAYRKGDQQPGPFTCDICGAPKPRPSNLERRRQRWGLPE